MGRSSSVFNTVDFSNIFKPTPTQSFIGPTQPKSKSSELAPEVIAEQKRLAEKYGIQTFDRSGNVTFDGTTKNKRTTRYTPKSKSTPKAPTPIQPINLDQFAEAGKNIQAPTVTPKQIQSIIPQAEATSELVSDFRQKNLDFQGPQQGFDVQQPRTTYEFGQLEPQQPDQPLFGQQDQPSFEPTGNARLDKLQQQSSLAADNVNSLKRQLSDIDDQMFSEANRLRGRLGNANVNVENEAELLDLSNRYRALFAERGEIQLQLKSATGAQTRVDELLENAESEEETKPDENKTVSGIIDYNPMEFKGQLSPVYTPPTSPEENAIANGQGGTIIDPNFSLLDIAKDKATDSEFNQGIPTFEALQQGPQRDEIAEINAGAQRMDADSQGLLEREPTLDATDATLQGLGRTGAGLANFFRIPTAHAEEYPEEEQEYQEPQRPTSLDQLAESSQEPEYQEDSPVTFGDGYQEGQEEPQPQQQQQQDDGVAGLSGIGGLSLTPEIKQRIFEQQQQQRIDEAQEGPRDPTLEQAPQAPDPTEFFSLQGQQILKGYDAFKQGANVFTVQKDGIVEDFGQDWVGPYGEKTSDLEKPEGSNNILLTNLNATIPPPMDAGFDKFDAASTIPAADLNQGIEALPFTGDASTQELYLQATQKLGEQGYLQDKDGNEGFLSTGGRFGQMQINNVSRTGQPQFDEKGNEIPQRFDGREGEIISSIYGRQLNDRLENEKQKAYVQKLRAGQVSISDALLNPRTSQSRFKGGTQVSSTVTEKQKKFIETYFDERGISLDEQIGSVKLGPVTFTKDQIDAARTLDPTDKALTKEIKKSFDKYPGSFPKEYTERLVAGNTIGYEALSDDPKLFRKTIDGKPLLASQKPNPAEIQEAEFRLALLRITGDGNAVKALSPDIAESFEDFSNDARGRKIETTTVDGEVFNKVDKDGNVIYAKDSKGNPIYEGEFDQFIISYTNRDGSLGNIATNGTSLQNDMQNVYLESDKDLVSVTPYDPESGIGATPDEYIANLQKINILAEQQEKVDKANIEQAIDETGYGEFIPGMSADEIYSTMKGEKPADVKIAVPPTAAGFILGSAAVLPLITGASSFAALPSLDFSEAVKPKPQTVITRDISGNIVGYSQGDGTIPPVVPQDPGLELATGGIAVAPPFPRTGNVNVDEWTNQTITYDPTTGFPNPLKPIPITADLSQDPLGFAGQQFKQFLQGGAYPITNIGATVKGAAEGAAEGDVVGGISRQVMGTTALDQTIEAFGEGYSEDVGYKPLDVSGLVSGKDYTPGSDIRNDGKDAPGPLDYIRDIGLTGYAHLGGVVNQATQRSQSEKDDPGFLPAGTIGAILAPTGAGLMLIDKKDNTLFGVKLDDIEYNTRYSDAAPKVDAKFTELGKDILKNPAFYVGSVASEVATFIAAPLAGGKAVKAAEKGAKISANVYAGISVVGGTGGGVSIRSPVTATKSLWTGLRTGGLSLQNPVKITTPAMKVAEANRILLSPAYATSIGTPGLTSASVTAAKGGVSATQAARIGGLGIIKLTPKEYGTRIAGQLGQIIEKGLKPKIQFVEPQFVQEQVEARILAPGGRIENVPIYSTGVDPRYAGGEVPLTSSLSTINAGVVSKLDNIAIKTGTYTPNQLVDLKKSIGIDSNYIATIKADIDNKIGSLPASPEVIAYKQELDIIPNVYDQIKTVGGQQSDSLYFRGPMLSSEPAPAVDAFNVFGPTRPSTFGDDFRPTQIPNETVQKNRIRLEKIDDEIASKEKLLKAYESGELAKINKLEDTLKKLKTSEQNVGNKSLIKDITAELKELKNGYAYKSYKDLKKEVKQLDTNAEKIRTKVSSYDDYKETITGSSFDDTIGLLRSGDVLPSTSASSTTLAELPANISFGTQPIGNVIGASRATTDFGALPKKVKTTYHGTSVESAENILKEGVDDNRNFFHTKDFKYAEVIAKGDTERLGRSGIRAKYGNDYKPTLTDFKPSNDGVVLKITSDELTGDILKIEGLGKKWINPSNQNILESNILGSVRRTDVKSPGIGAVPIKLEDFLSLRRGGEVKTIDDLDDGMSELFRISANSNKKIGIGFESPDGNYIGTGGQQGVKLSDRVKVLNQLFVGARVAPNIAERNDILGVIKNNLNTLTKDQFKGAGDEKIFTQVQKVSKDFDTFLAKSAAPDPNDVIAQSVNEPIFLEGVTDISSADNELFTSSIGQLSKQENVRVRTEVVSGKPITEISDGAQDAQVLLEFTSHYAGVQGRKWTVKKSDWQKSMKENNDVMKQVNAGTGKLEIKIISGGSPTGRPFGVILKKDKYPKLMLEQLGLDDGVPDPLDPSFMRYSMLKPEDQIEIAIKRKSHNITLNDDIMKQYGDLIDDLTVPVKTGKNKKLFKESEQDELDMINEILTGTKGRKWKGIAFEKDGILELRNSKNLKGTGRSIKGVKFAGITKIKGGKKKFEKGYYLFGQLNDDTMKYLKSTGGIRTVNRHQQLGDRKAKIVFEKLIERKTILDQKKNTAKEIAKNEIVEAETLKINELLVEDIFDGTLINNPTDLSKIMQQTHRLNKDFVLFQLAKRNGATVKDLKSEYNTLYSSLGLSKTLKSENTLAPTDKQFKNMLKTLEDKKEIKQGKVYDKNKKEYVDDGKYYVTSGKTLKENNLIIANDLNPQKIHKLLSKSNVKDPKVQGPVKPNPAFIVENQLKNALGENFSKLENFMTKNDFYKPDDYSNIRKTIHTVESSGLGSSPSTIIRGKSSTIFTKSKSDVTKKGQKYVAKGGGKFPYPTNILPEITVYNSASDGLITELLENAVRGRRLKSIEADKQYQTQALGKYYLAKNNVNDINEQIFLAKSSKKTKYGQTIEDLEAKLVIANDELEDTALLFKTSRVSDNRGTQTFNYDDVYRTVKSINRSEAEKIRLREESATASAQVVKSETEIKLATQKAERYNELAVEGEHGGATARTYYDEQGKPIPSPLKLKSKLEKKIKEMQDEGYEVTAVYNQSVQSLVLKQKEAKLKKLLDTISKTSDISPKSKAKVTKMIKQAEKLENEITLIKNSKRNIEIIQDQPGDNIIKQGHWSNVNMVEKRWQVTKAKDASGGFILPKQGDKSGKAIEYENILNTTQDQLVQTNPVFVNIDSYKHRLLQLTDGKQAISENLEEVEALLKVLEVEGFNSKAKPPFFKSINSSRQIEKLETDLRVEYGYNSNLATTPNGRELEMAKVKPKYKIRVEKILSEIGELKKKKSIDVPVNNWDEIIDSKDGSRFKLDKSKIVTQEDIDNFNTGLQDVDELTGKSFSDIDEILEFSKDPETGKINIDSLRKNYVTKDNQGRDYRGSIYDSDPEDSFNITGADFQGKKSNRFGVRSEEQSKKGQEHWMDKALEDNTTIVPEKMPMMYAELKKMQKHLKEASKATDKEMGLTNINLINANEYSKNTDEILQAIGGTPKTEGTKYVAITPMARNAENELNILFKNSFANDKDYDKAVNSRANISDAVKSRTESERTMMSNWKDAERTWTSTDNKLSKTIYKVLQMTEKEKYYKEHAPKVLKRMISGGETTENGKIVKQLGDKTLVSIDPDDVVRRLNSVETTLPKNEIIKIDKVTTQLDKEWKIWLSDETTRYKDKLVKNVKAKPRPGYKNAWGKEVLFKGGKSKWRKDRNFRQHEKTPENDAQMANNLDLLITELQNKVSTYKPYPSQSGNKLYATIKATIDDDLTILGANKVILKNTSKSLISDRNNINKMTMRINKIEKGVNNSNMSPEMKEWVKMENNQYAMLRDKMELKRTNEILKKRKATTTIEDNANLINKETAAINLKTGKLAKGSDTSSKSLTKMQTLTTFTVAPGVNPQKLSDNIATLVKWPFAGKGTETMPPNVKKAMEVVTGGKKNVKREALYATKQDMENVLTDSERGIANFGDEPKRAKFEEDILESQSIKQDEGLLTEVEQGMSAFDVMRVLRNKDLPLSTRLSALVPSRKGSIGRQLRKIKRGVSEPSDVPIGPRNIPKDSPNLTKIQNDIINNEGERIQEFDLMKGKIAVNETEERLIKNTIATPNKLENLVKFWANNNKTPAKIKDAQVVNTGYQELLKKLNITNPPNVVNDVVETTGKFTNIDKNFLIQFTKSQDDINKSTKAFNKMKKNKLIQDEKNSLIAEKDSIVNNYTKEILKKNGKITDSDIHKMNILIDAKEKNISILSEAQKVLGQTIENPSILINEKEFSKFGSTLDIVKANNAIVNKKQKLLKLQNTYIESSKKSIFDDVLSETKLQVKVVRKSKKLTPEQKQSAVNYLKMKHADDKIGFLTIERNELQTKYNKTIKQFEFSGTGADDMSDNVAFNYAFDTSKTLEQKISKIDTKIDALKIDVNKYEGEMYSGAISSLKDKFRFATQWEKDVPPSIGKPGSGGMDITTGETITQFDTVGKEFTGNELAYNLPLKPELESVNPVIYDIISHKQVKRVQKYPEVAAKVPDNKFFKTKSASNKWVDVDVKPDPSDLGVPGKEFQIMGALEQQTKDADNLKKMRESFGNIYRNEDVAKRLREKQKTKTKTKIKTKTTTASYLLSGSGVGASVFGSNVAYGEEYGKVIQPPFNTPNPFSVPQPTPPAGIPSNKIITEATKPSLQIDYSIASGVGIKSGNLIDTKLNTNVRIKQSLIPALKPELIVGGKLTQLPRQRVITPTKLDIATKPKLIAPPLLKPLLFAPFPPTEKPLLRPRVPIIPPVPFWLSSAKKKRKKEKKKKGKKKTIVWAVPDVWFGKYDPEEYKVIGKNAKTPKKFQTGNFGFDSEFA